MKLDRIVVKSQNTTGQPVIRGTDVSVAAVLNLMTSGLSRAEILTVFPELESEDLMQISEYASSLAGHFHLPN